MNVNMNAYDDIHMQSKKRSSIQRIMNAVDNEYLNVYNFYNGYHADYDEMAKFTEDLTDVLSNDELSILNDIQKNNISLLVYYVSMFSLKKKINIHALILTMKAMLRMYHANPGLFNNIQGIEQRKQKPYYLNTDDYEDILSSFYHLYNYDDYMNMKNNADTWNTDIHIDYVMFMKHNDYIMSRHPDNNRKYAFNTVINKSFTDEVNLADDITEYYKNHVNKNKNANNGIHVFHNNSHSTDDSVELNDYTDNHSDVNGAVYIDYMLSMYEDTLDYNILVMFHRNNLNAVYMSEITDYLIQSYAYYMFLDTVRNMNNQYHNDLHGYDWGLLLHDSDTFYVDLSETTPVRIMALIYAYEHMHDVDSWSEMRINDAMSALESALQEILHDTNRSNVYDLNVDSIYYELELDYAYADASNLDVIILLMRLTTDLCLIQDFIAHDKDESSYGYTLFNEPDSWENYTSDCIINGYTVEYMIENLKIKYNNGMLNSDYGY